MSFRTAARVSSAGLNCPRHLRSKAWGAWPSKDQVPNPGQHPSSKCPSAEGCADSCLQTNLLPCVATKENKYHVDLIIFCFVFQSIHVSLPFSRMREASSRPKREYKPKPRETYDFGDTDQSNGGFSCNPTPKVSGKVVPCVCTQVPLEQPPGDRGELLYLEMMFLVCWMCLPGL